MKNIEETYKATHADLGTMIKYFCQFQDTQEETNMEMAEMQEGNKCSHILAGENQQEWLNKAAHKKGAQANSTAWHPPPPHQQSQACVRAQHTTQNQKRECQPPKGTTAGN